MIGLMVLGLTACGPSKSLPKDGVKSNGKMVGSAT
jgi:hypothetical protein